MANNLAEFVDDLIGKESALKEEVIGAISTLAGKDDLLAAIRKAGILEGITKTRGELERFMRGDSEDQEDN